MFKDKNVMTMDIWVAVVLFITLLRPGTILTKLTHFGLMGVFLTSIVLIFCSRLRGYRYIDYYIGCKKPASELLLPALIAFIISTIGFTLWVGSTLYYLVVVLIIIILSLHFNYAQDLKGDNNGCEKEDN